MKKYEKVVTVMKKGKKLFVIKIFRKGNGAMKYVFGQDGERLSPKLITNDMADLLIAKILQQQNPDVHIIGEIGDYTALQNLKLNGRIMLGGYE